MKNSLKKILQISCSLLVLTAAVCFANEPDKKEGDKCCPVPPAQSSCGDCTNHCGKCDKKDADKDKDCPACPSCPCCPDKK